MLRNAGENSWRWMVGVEAIPAFLYTIFVIGVPKSPRWLISKSRYDEAKEILKITDYGSDLESIILGIKSDNENHNDHENIFIKKYRVPLKLVFLIAFFNQLSGINAFLYYAPRIFEESGLGASTALLSSIGIGFTNLIFTLIGVS